MSRKNIVKLVMLRNNVVSAAKEWKKIYCFQDGSYGTKNEEALELAIENLFEAVEKLEAL